MIQTSIEFDMRSPAFGAPTGDLYAAALDMAEYADSHGIDFIGVQEHHQAADNYIPAPFVLAAAFAARTKRIRLMLNAVILPLHDPVKISEQIAVLDQISHGRVDVVFGAGYVKPEFDAFGVSLKDRARLMDEGLSLIQRALTGERFQAGGRTVFVRPLPVQKPVPFYLGGGVQATARRAARFGIGLWPMHPDIIPVFEEECRKAGRHRGPLIGHLGWIHVSENPDSTWAEIAPHVAHVAKAYSDWGSDGESSSSPFQAVTTVEAMKASGLYQVLRPDECVSLAKKLQPPAFGLSLAPLIGGLSPEIGWKNLRLFAEKVVPHL